MPTQKERKRGLLRAIRIGLMLVVMISVYTVGMLLLVPRYQRLGSEVGVNSEVFLFQKGSIRDWFGCMVLRPWIYALGQPVYWY